MTQRGSSIPSLLCSHFFTTLGEKVQNIVRATWGIESGTILDVHAVPVLIVGYLLGHSKN